MYTNHKLQNTLLLHRNEFSTDCTPSFHSLHYFQQEITSYKFLAKIETHSSIGCHYKLTSHYFSFSHYQSAISNFIHISSVCLFIEGKKIYKK